ncbi:MAG: hypothetical protein IKI31_07320, partial [Treponema sp.]|nr:hypothetical protein [Treponema sp.]
MILFIFSSCVALQELFGINPSGSSSGSSGELKSQGTKVSVSSTKSSAKQTGTKILSQIYKTPDSYEEAYLYRADAPEQKIRTLIRSAELETLRKTNPREWVKKIVGQIADTSKNEFEKVKMIHDAVALLVQYDAKSYWAGSVPQQDWQTVVSTKLAVCEGYSNLFKYMCDVAGVQCQKVSGYARGVGSSLIDEKSPDNSNHAWNIVNVNDAWYVVDCTWDSGYMDGRIARQKYTTDWLFLKPEHMIYTHFPSNSRNQLLRTPLTAKEFYNLPEIKPKFFDAFSVDEENLPSKKMIAKNSMRFFYSLNEGFDISVSLINVATRMEPKNCTLIQNNGENSFCKFSFSEKGTYLVNVFYMKKGSRSGEMCMQFVVESEEGSAVRFPQVYSVSSKNARLISPVEMPLKSEEPVSFKVFVSDKKFVT